MIKFSTQIDEQTFYLETGFTKDNLDEDQVHRYLKSRRDKVFKIKDFRKSQNTKAAWRRSRWTYMKSIKKFHRSIAGKRFHRQLSRFLSSRLRENYDDTVDRFETLKAVTSLKTHLLIECSYYRSNLDESVDLELLLDYSRDILNSIEFKLFERRGNEIDVHEVEFLLRCVDPKLLSEEIQSKFGNGLPDLNEGLTSEEFDESLQFVESLAKSLKLKSLMETVRHEYGELETNTA